MDYENERWIKVFTRDTGAWLDLTWQARGLALEIARKLDAVGELSLGRRGLSSLAGLLRAPWEEIEPFVLELLMEGRLVYEADRQVILDPGHGDRQATVTTSAERKRRQREREQNEREREIARLPALRQVPTEPPARSRDVTQSRERVTRVTSSHEGVTAGHDQRDQIRETRSDETIPLPPADVGPVDAAAPEPERPRRVVGADGDSGFLFAAWGEGIRAASGCPQTPLSPAERREVVAMAQTHAGGAQGQALLDWARTTAHAFAAQHDPAFGGYTPSGARKWLNAGKPSRAAPRRIRPADVVQPAIAGSWEVPEAIS